MYNKVINTKEKMKYNKKDLNYVLVPDVIAGGILTYYTGYFNLKIIGPNKKPIIFAATDPDFSKAMKIPYKEEAELICIGVNENTMCGSFHVEEHMYM